MTPTEVWILGFRYRIIGRREDAPDWIQSMSEQTFTAITADGFCDTKWHVIYAAADRSEDYRRETVLHEVFHAIDHCLNFGEDAVMSDANLQLTARCTVHGEDYLQRHNRTLLSVLRDPRNKELTTWLLA